MARKGNTLKANTDSNEVSELKRKLAELEEKENLRDGSTDDIKLDTYVQVMSLCPYTLTLHTESQGKGKKFEFRNFGEVKNIIYANLVDLLEINRSFVEAGYFYILNPKIVRRHGLDEIYKNILDKDMMMKIVNCDPKTAVKFYEKATPAQKEMVEFMLIRAIRNNEADLNVVSGISLVAKKDLALIANESKQLEELTIQK